MYVMWCDVMWCMYVCMRVLGQLLDATLQCLHRTCTDPYCYIIGSFLVQAQTVDVTLQDHIFYTRRQLMHRLKKLLYKIFSPRRLMLRCKILSCTCTDTSCCVPRPYILHAQTPDGLWKDLLLYLHTCTDAWAWCYVKRSSLVLAQTLDARAGGGTEPQTRTI